MFESLGMQKRPSQVAFPCVFSCQTPWRHAPRAFRKAERHGPGARVPDLQAAIPGAAHHGGLEGLQREDAPEVRRLEAGHGLEVREVPDADRAVLRARDLAG